MFGQGDFPVSYSKRDTVIYEFLWSIRESYSAIWSLPLTNVKWHSDPWPTVTAQPIRISTNSMTSITSLTFTEFWLVSMEHLQRVWHASRERLSFRTPVSVPLFWDLLVLRLLRPDSSNLPCILLIFSPWIPLGTFSILLDRNFDTFNNGFYYRKYLDWGWVTSSCIASNKSASRIT